jgi:hypothetical protein
MYRAGFSVHDFFSAHNVTTKNGAYRLLSKANAKYWQLPGKVLDNLHGYSRLFWRTRARGNTNAGWGKPLNTLDINFIVAMHLDLGAQLPKVLNNIPGEGVIVVEH